MAMATATLDKRETSSLIGSDKVEGTAVYRANGDKLGTIERVMIDKLSGKVAYAVMSFGGFLGLGHDHYPIPWSLLRYDTRLEGYVVEMNDEQLKGAPRFTADHPFDWNDNERGRRVYDYYKVPFYLG
jgi:sporulation protein YlmC with PRC-barrel domain